MNQINSFLSTLRTAYDQQGQWGKILIPGLSLLIFCCLCLGVIGLARVGTGSGEPATVLPSPILATSDGTQPTPTALFDFDFPTLTPFPTLPFPTALPTLTPLPTMTSSVTPTAPTPSGTSLPTMTSPPPTATNPPPTATNAGSVRIVTVDKPAEYVDLQNFTAEPVNLDGWRLVSETGNQSCRLRGTLPPNDILRVWARRGNPGFDCRFPVNIWNDNMADPAVLYNPQGQEVSRFP